MEESKTSEPAEKTYQILVYDRRSIMRRPRKCVMEIMKFCDNNNGTPYIAAALYQENQLMLNGVSWFFYE